MTPLVTLRDVHVELGGTPILNGVTADVARGKITALIGLNGSGKTTLLRAILKEMPYRGRIDFHCGHDHRHPVPEHVGYVPQKLQIDASLPLTVRDLLALALQPRPLFFGVARRTEAELRAMLELVGAPAALLDRPFEKLSGGEQQRVLLSLALHPSPELLLLDEPAAGVDVKGQEQFYDLIARLNKERGVTILLVSHDVTMVSRFVDQVLCMKDGRIRCEGQPREVMTEATLADIFGGQRGIFAHHHPG